MDLRTLASGVYLAFLIPGLMSLVAQVSGENRLIWQVAFSVAAVLGIFYTIRLMRKTRDVRAQDQVLPQSLGRGGDLAFILIFALFPFLALFLGSTSANGGDPAGGVDPHRPRPELGLPYDAKPRETITERRPRARASLVPAA